VAPKTLEPLFIDKRIKFDQKLINCLMKSFSTSMDRIYHGQLSRAGCKGQKISLDDKTLAPLTEGSSIGKLEKQKKRKQQQRQKDEGASLFPLSSRTKKSGVTSKGRSLGGGSDGQKYPRYMTWCVCVCPCLPTSSQLRRTLADAIAWIRASERTIKLLLLLLRCLTACYIV